MSWNTDEIYTTQNHTSTDDKSDNDAKIRMQFTHFLKSFLVQNQAIYYDQINNCKDDISPCIEVNLDHIQAYSSEFGASFLSQPDRYINLLEQATLNVANDITGNDKLSSIQVVLSTSATPTPMRDVKANYVGKLVVIPGLVISTSTVSAKATKMIARCKGCQNTITISPNADGTLIIPRKCQTPNSSSGGPPSQLRKCPLDPYVIEPEQSTFTDFQYIKIQEAPEDVPAGEMPHHVSASVERALVNTTIPGKRNLFVVIPRMIAGKSNTQRSVFKIVGVMNTDKEEQISDAPPIEEFNTRAKIVKAIAPEIYGMEDVKEAIACQLFSGNAQQLPDMRIRGDINVLLLGDPSVAKSQLLKFAHKVSPIGIYTSGKGSSAAGLTASVVRHAGSGEFYLEGGAMVLADGGLVCIDEFDKMRLEDRVAIHEAMEQQTISIAKAGLTAVLNTRTAVLAAANPLAGRFDTLKSARDNIDFQTTILSRFDMIFVLRDIINENRDRQIAEHVVRLHSTAYEEVTPQNNPILMLKRYIQYARKRCNPVLTEAAATLLQNEYVKMRSSVNKSKHETIPITVRQLEALSRISTALAKMELSSECKEEHVREAIRLFQLSTFDAAKTGVIAPEGILTEEQKREVEKLENYINRRCPVGSRIPEKAIISELQKQSFSDYCIIRVLQSMLFEGQFEYQNQRQVLKRVLNKDGE